jgi:cytochrome bd-type quinol oxidase subunit 2
MFSKFKIQNSKFKIQNLFFLLCFLFFQISSYAQCAMCRAALTSEGNAVKAQAVNDGIVYLMVIPYLLVGGIGFYIYRMRKKKKQ